jgi:O-succinylbenzoic acid--CoA ligase
MHTIPNWLRQRAHISPDRLAIICDGQRITFRELRLWVDSAALKLATVGVNNGDRVALLMRNSLDFVVLVHAASRIGAVLVPLNIRLTAAEIMWQLNDVNAKALIYDAANRDVGINATNIANYSTDDFHTLSEAPIALRDEIDLDAVHSIVYTSGTTGKPKGAMLTYGNHWWNATASALNLGVMSDDVWLAVLPLFHVGGMAILLRTVIYGNTAVIHQTFDPAAVNRDIDAEKVSVISVVSAMLQRLIEDRGDVAYPQSLRCMLLGGGPAPQPLLEACASRAIPVVQTYGMTETASQFATLTPTDALRKLGSAGKPLIVNQLRIERDGQIVAVGEVGEIVLRGPTVTIGYVNRPDATAAAIRDGWLHTGDLGYVDNEGYLYVVSRRDDLIISGGENVYPAEIEAVLMSHPAVAEAGVTGLPDDRWGQVPVAAIRLRDGQQVPTDDLRTHCAARLAKFKIPAEFRFVEALPRNATGKLLRIKLAELWD